MLIPESRRPVLIFAFLLAVTLLVYHSTYISMISVWANSGTYQYGFLILPLVLYLIWLKREGLSKITPVAYPQGMLIVAALCALWFLGELASTQVIQHFSTVGLIPALVLVILGKEMFRYLLFPLLYLMFAVPAGESLTYPMQTITAEIVFFILGLTDIPVFREGQLLHIPAGTFEVAEACSGIRFLTATIILSIFYVYITYNKMYKRLIFMVFAFVIPIIANGLRAFFIVLAGHFISMEFAGGADHIIFGWQLFGLILLLLFWLGSRWRDE